MQSPHVAKHKWHMLPLAIADQQLHIDQGEHFLATIAPGDPAILYWSMARPAGLVLGFSQNPDVLNQAAVARTNLPLYHRRAGGTAVLVGPHMLSLDVVLPPDSPLILADVVESYRWLGEVWVETLLRLGVQTRIIPLQEARAQRTLLKQEETRARESLLNRACYGTLSPYEVAVGQRKVVGLDMIRRRAGTLLQAGLLLRWETETLSEVLGHTPEEQSLLREGLLARAVGIDPLIGHVIPPEEVIAAFEQVILGI